MDLGQFSADIDRSTVGAVETYQHIHQSALSCPVLTEKSEHLSGVELQGDIVVSQYAGKMFRDMFHTYYWGLLCLLVHCFPIQVGMPRGSVAPVHLFDFSKKGRPESALLSVCVCVI